MIPKPEEEPGLRRYLLGDLSPEEREPIEERLLVDDHLIDQLAFVEEELVDDYLFDQLSSHERQRFEEHFLMVPERRQKLDLARQLRQYASSAEVPRAGPSRMASELWKWKHLLFVPWWKAAAYGVLLLGLGLWAVNRHFMKSPIEQALAALNQAYRSERPVEARVTGFSYAEFKFSAQRGGPVGRDSKLDGRKVDYVALDRVRIFLFGPDVNSSDPAVMQALGKYYLTQQEFDQAIDQFTKALAADPNNVSLHNDLGAALFGRIERDRATRNGRSMTDVEECLKHLNRALDLDPGRLEALFNRALLYQRERLRREARDDWERYRQLDPDSPWGQEARENLQAIERELQKVSQRNKQLYQDFLQAQREGRTLQALEILGQSYTYNGNTIVENLIDAFLEAKQNGRSDEAREHLRLLVETGLLSERQTGDRYLAELADYYRQADPPRLARMRQARALIKEAYQLHQKAQIDQALKKYDQGRQLFEESGNQGEALMAEVFQGRGYYQQSNTRKILQIFTRLVPLSAEKKYLWIAASAYCGLANGHDSLGQVSQAIDDTVQCKRLSEQAGDRIGVVRSLQFHGWFYKDLGKHHEALQISQQGMDFSDKYAADLRYAIAFYQITSLSLTGLGLLESARAFQLEAVKMAEETKSPRLIVYSHFHLGYIYGKWKKYDEAISSIQRGIAIGREQDDATGRDFVNYGLSFLGNVYREAGRFSEALVAFDKVLEFFEQSGRQFFLYTGLKGRLLTLIAQDQDAAAQAEIGRVIDLYERYRSSIQEESNRNTFFDQEQDIYDIAIKFAQTRLHDSRQALTYSELCRARSLLDATKRGWQTIAGPEAPDLKILTGAAPEGVETLQRRMPDQVQLVEYAMVDDRLLVWVISKESIESRELLISPAELTAQIEQYLESIGRPPDRDDRLWRERSEKLYDTLIRPYQDLLERSKQLCIVPDKVLNRLPFGTLIDRRSGRLLVEEYRLSSAPSANLFLGATEQARRKTGVQMGRGPERLLAVGDPEFLESEFPGLPRLPSAEQEARAIADYYPAPVLLVNSQARKSAVMREMQRADVVHLAIHYEVNSRSPMWSRMPMASTAPGESEGALHMYELYQLKSLHPRLVVLSGCQTTAEDYSRGEGVIGISRPFEAAGIPMVIASLWPVDTVATSDLMVAFHRERKQSKLSAVDALRSAQLELLSRTDKYRHPYYWAAFVAVGGYSEY
ncbi:MAG TPA: CHAT domain-containing protein [Blastocatellia bacterium]|nr:CHAT domain-containing protein [Blastocatellia bacterium]